MSTIETSPITKKAIAYVVAHPQEYGLVKLASDRPKIVCLCGSSRFRDAFNKAEFDETMKGKIVLTVACTHYDRGDTPIDRPMLDELHKRKIDIADEVLILNVGGYIGQSTRSEINYALEHGKSVKYSE